MDSARKDASDILQSPGADLEHLQQSLKAQTEHVARLRAVCLEAAEKLAIRRTEKEGLLEELRSAK